MLIVGRRNVAGAGLSCIELEQADAKGADDAEAAEGDVGAV